MDNLAYDYQSEDFVFEDEPDYELIEGVKFISLVPTAKHSSLVGRLITVFNYYVDEKDIIARVFGDNTDVYLSKEDHFRPDMSVVCNLNIIDWNGAVKGAPDLVVEVLSKSTMKNDKSLKKKVYAKYGVKEYWIVSPWAKSIEVYHLIDGNFELDEVYSVYSKSEWERLTDKERSESKFEIKVSIFEDLFVDVRKIFKWWLDE